MDDSLAGKLLVAMPGMSDSRFHQAVIMLCLHTRDHAMGLVLNKPKETLKLGDVLQHLGIDARAELAPRQVMDGGPVKPDRGYVLHSPDYAAGDDATQEVAPGVSLTATRDVLEAMAGQAAPKQFLFALGCSGWGAGQLEDELRANAWLVVDPDEAIVFSDNHQTKWDLAIRRLGFDPGQLAGEAGRA